MKLHYCTLKLGKSNLGQNLSGLVYFLGEHFLLGCSSLCGLAFILQIVLLIIVLAYIEAIATSLFITYNIYLSLMVALEVDTTMSSF